MSYTENKMLPPTIPTSFVPHATSAASRHSRVDFAGVFSFLMYMVLGVVFVLAVGIFFYGRILSSDRIAKDTALAQAEATINPTTVEAFVRLRDRLASGNTLLANHTAFSGFFSLLGTLMPSTVRFSSLHLSIDEKRTIKLEGLGVAKSFNALAAASTAFSQDGHIKDAIFSNIVVNPRNNSVSFVLAATLDPKTIAFSPKAYEAIPLPVPVVPPAATSTSGLISTSTSPVRTTPAASSGQASSSKPKL